MAAAAADARARTNAVIPITAFMEMLGEPICPSGPWRPAHGLERRGSLRSWYPPRQQGHSQRTARADDMPSLEARPNLRPRLAGNGARPRERTRMGAYLVGASLCGAL